MMTVPGDRPNVESAQVVEDGVRLQISLGKLYAAKYLVSHGVPFSVVVRVLAEPKKRRSYAVVPSSDEAPIHET
jgi:hypothetical protein